MGETAPPPSGTELDLKALAKLDPTRKLEVEQSLNRVARHATELLTPGLPDSHRVMLQTLIDAETTTVKLYLFAEATSDVNQVRKRVGELAMAFATRGVAALLTAV